MKTHEYKVDVAFASPNKEWMQLSIEFPSSGEIVSLDLLFGDLLDGYTYINKLLQSGEEMELLRNKEHPLQLMNMLVTIQWLGNNIGDIEHRRRVYDVIRSNFHAIKETELFRRCIHQWRSKEREIIKGLPYPYSLDDGIKPAVIALKEGLGVNTLWSCEGIQHFLEIDGFKIYLPDGHNLFSYLVWKRDGKGEDFFAELTSKCPCNIEVKEEMDRFYVGTRCMEDNHRFVEFLNDLTSPHLLEAASKLKEGRKYAGCPEEVESLLLLRL